MFINKSTGYSNLFLKENPACTAKQKSKRAINKIVVTMSERAFQQASRFAFIARAFRFIPSETVLEVMLTPFRKQS